MFEFNGLGDWVIYDTGDSGFFSEEAMGIAALYSYGTGLVIVTEWSLLIGVVEVSRSHGSVGPGPRTPSQKAKGRRTNVCKAAFL